MPHPTKPLWFHDRREAGEELAAALLRDGISADLVLAVPRGGVIVAEPVARRLGAPLDALLARKVGAPMQPELAMGAVTRFGVVWNPNALDALYLSTGAVEQARAQAAAELQRRERAFRAVRPPETVGDHSVILVDDGLATGATVAAGVRALQSAGAAAVVVAVPVASLDAVERIEAFAVRVVALSVPHRFGAVGAFYEDFQPVSDEDCLAILRRATR